MVVVLFFVYNHVYCRKRQLQVGSGGCMAVVIKGLM